MEALSKLDAINLPSIMLEYMNKIIIVKDRKHELVHGCLMNYVFEHFGV